MDIRYYKLRWANNYHKFSYIQLYNTHNAILNQTPKFLKPGKISGKLISGKLLYSVYKYEAH